MNPPGSSNGDITGLLAAIRQGDARAESDLASLIYKDLHALARRQMGRERPDHTLQPTALVNEAYVRLMKQNRAGIKDRVHLFAAMSGVMRNVLVDHARERGAAKRPGKNRVELDDFLASTTPRLDQMLILDEVLSQLAELNARQARVVELIFFGGLTEEETAEVLGIHVRTVKRDWAAARAWLQVQLRRRSE